MIRLREYLEGKNTEELKTIFHFWSSKGTLPEKKSEIVKKLVESMMDDRILSAQFSQLSPRLKNLLSHFLRVKGYAMGWKQLQKEAETLVRSNQLEAAVHALAQRGFLAVDRDTKFSGRGNARFMMPLEVGAALLSHMKEKESLAAIFSLKDFLNAKGGRDAASTFLKLKNLDLLRKSSEPPFSQLLRERLKRRRDPELARILPVVLQQFGGILPRTRYIQMGKSPWRGKEWAMELEEDLLGTVAFLSLEEYGINLMDETIVLFREWTEGVLLNPLRKKPDRVLCSRVNMVVDMENLVYRTMQNPLRVTRAGGLSKTSQKGFLPFLVDTDLPNETPEGYFDTLFQVSTELGLLQEHGEIFYASPKDFQKWKRLSLRRKIKEMFQIVASARFSTMESFHHPRIKKICLAIMKKLKPGKWYDSLALPFLSRNYYLSQLDQWNIKQLYQNHRHYSSQPPQFDPDEMARNIHSFLVKKLFPLGLVDLGMKGRKIIAVKLSPLWAEIFKRKGRRKKGRPPLIASPDFEIVVIPEETDYDLLYRIHQFSRRIHSERVDQFRVSAESVHEAVSRGISCKEILSALKENSRNPLPQNVEFSIQEWASEVRFVRFEKAILLRGGDPQAIDRILSSGILKDLLPERVSGTVLALKGEISEKNRKEIENLGIYIHGEE